MNRPKARRAVPTEDAAGLFLLLPADRRQAIAEESLEVAARSLVGAHRAGVLGGFVDALLAHPYWSHLQHLPAAHLLRAELAEAAPRALSSPLVSAAKAIAAAPPASPVAAKKSDAAARVERSSAASSPARAVPARPGVAEAPLVKAAATGDGVDLAVAALGDLLAESEPKALAELREVVTIYGLDLVREVYQKTVEIEAGGGLLREGYRKTPGGVFFYLAKSAGGRSLLGPEFVERALAAKRAAPPKPQQAPQPKAAPGPKVTSEPSAAPLSTPAPGSKAAHEPKIATPPRPKPKPQGPDLMAAVIAFIAEHPGARADEIQLRVGGDKLLLRAALEALRAMKRLRTNGTGRRAMYTVAG